MNQGYHLLFLMVSILGYRIIGRYGCQFPHTSWSFCIETVVLDFEAVVLASSFWKCPLTRYGT
jgi:hypothetical protein